MVRCASRFSLGLTATAMVLCGLSSCSVVGSLPVDAMAGLEAPGVSPLAQVRCKTKLGSYSLPKSLLRVRVMKPAAGAGFHTITVTQGADERVPDNRYTFCLDHLANAFADDTVRVFKEKITESAANGHSSTDDSKKATPFLQLVASRAKDESVEIIRKIIRTAFIVISGNPNFSSARAAIEGTGATEVVRDLSFDPFDQHELAEINQSIAPLGFCVVLGDYSFNVRATTIERYCANPQTVVRNQPSKVAQAAKRQRFIESKPSNGIFYRPRADYRVSVYVKADPGGRDSWRLALSQNFQFENISPIIAVGVGRSTFATHRTALVFDDGVLTDVCIAKGSQVAGFLNIPLDVVYGVIALPTQTIQAAIDSTDTRRQLLTAQSQLIQAQEAYIAYLADPDITSAPAIGDKNEASGLKLGAESTAGVPAPVTADLADYGLSGSTSELATDSILNQVCAELVAANSGSIFNAGANAGAKF